MGRASRSALPALAVGTTAWWSLTLALSQTCPASHTANGGSRLDQCRDARLHIVRQIPAVRPGVSRELLVIEGLQVVQRLLGGVAQGAVGLPLEGGQIKKGGWLLRFLPPLHRLDHGGAALAPGGGLLRLFLAGLPVPGQGETVTVQLHHVERLRLERGDLRLPLDHQRQRGGDHAANVQSAAIEQGEQPGGVDAHQPVRLGPAEGGLMQPVNILCDDCFYLTSRMASSSMEEIHSREMGLEQPARA